MNRLKLLLGVALVTATIALSGCYTKLGVQDPYGFDGYGDYYDNSGADWTEVYYVYVPYVPWRAYAGHDWWYHDYHRYWDGPRHHYDDYDEYDEVGGRYGWDRGPGAPTPPRVGIGSVSGGGSGGATPTQTAQPQSKNPAREGKSTPKPEEEKKPDESTKKDRRGWRR